MPKSTDSIKESDISCADTLARLLITCPDQPGIVAAVTNFLYTHGVNITALDQYSSDPEGGLFFMRLEFQTPNLDISRAGLEQFFQRGVADRFDMNWRISYAADVKNMAILVSRHDHCLLELLWRWSRGELPCKVSMVVSNHPDLERDVTSFGASFHHIPFTKETRESAEAQMVELLHGQTDLIVLARFMQILSGDFVSRFDQQIINIHHSFLPAFAGADPYRQAHDKGVKIIGATAHYVTEELDKGPIIEQDTARVSHRQSIEELKNLGKDLERQVLARAVHWHLTDRIIVYGNKTVVF